MKFNSREVLSVIFLLLLLLTAAGCGSSTETVVEKEKKEEIEGNVYEPEIKIDIKEIYCWVDLMPGGPSRFHITGDLDVPDSYKYELSFINLELINIYQKNKLIFSIKPTVKVDESLTSAEIKSFIFSTLKGLIIKPDYNIDETVDIDFVFRESDDEFSFMLKNQKVEKVY